MNKGDAKTPAEGLDDTVLGAVAGGATISSSSTMLDGDPALAGHTPISVADAPTALPSSLAAKPPNAALDATALADPNALPSARTELAAGSGMSARKVERGKHLVSGSRIARFVVSGELGAGGMGVVYAAYDPTLDRKVAIKMLHEGISGTHRERLEREARAMAKLSHPNVVAVHEVGDFGARLFVAMEYVDGLTLRSWLSQKKPDRQEILRVMREAGQGLAAAHAAGMVHRDFKPDNVLVGKDGRVRVSDFGLVTPLGKDQLEEVIVDETSPRVSPNAALTMVGTVMGTPLYMAPEQHSGKVTDHRADQFSFCVTLWEALYQKTPYSAPSYEALVQNVNSGRLQSPPKGIEGPSWLRAVLTRGLSTTPEERYASMEELLAALAKDPWQLRRRLALGAGGVAVAAAAALALASKQDAKAQPCRDLGAAVESVWNPEKRAAIHQAFLASHADGAEEIWQRIDGELDRYAVDWRRLREQSCLTTSERGDTAAQFSNLSIPCFDRRLLAFSGVLALFSSAPNENVVRGAPRAVDDLDAVAYCSDPEYLSTRNPLPTAPEDLEKLNQLDAAYKEAKDLDFRGNHQEALDAVKALQVPVSALGYAPLQGKVLLLLGQVQQTLGNPKEAEKVLRLAAGAMAAAQDDVGLAQVWTHLLDLQVAQAKYDDALSIETAALTSAQRVPDELGLQARLQNSLGGVYLAKGRYEEAYGAYQKALELQRKIGAKGNYALAPAIANFGLARWYRGEIEPAREAFEEALQIMLKDYGPDHPQVAYAHKNLGDLDMQLGDYDRAKTHYDEVVRIWKVTLGEEHVNLAYAYEQLAQVAARTGDMSEALRYADLTMSLRRKNLGEDHPLTNQARSSVINVYMSLGTKDGYDKAEKEVDVGLAAATTQGEAGRLQMVYLLEERAALREARGDVPGALKDYQKVLEMRLELLGPKHLDVAGSFAVIARLSHLLGNNAVAETSALSAQAIYDEIPGAGDENAVNVRRIRAALRIEAGDRKAARDLLLEAVARATGDDNRVARWNTNFDLAKLDAQEGDAEGVGRAKAIRAEAAAALAEAQPVEHREIEHHLEEMDSWLETLPGSQSPANKN